MEIEKIPPEEEGKEIPKDENGFLSEDDALLEGTLVRSTAAAIKIKLENPDFGEDQMVQEGIRILEGGKKEEQPEKEHYIAGQHVVDTGFKFLTEEQKEELKKQFKKEPGE